MLVFHWSAVRNSVRLLLSEPIEGFRRGSGSAKKVFDRLLTAESGRSLFSGPLAQKSQTGAHMHIRFILKRCFEKILHTDWFDDIHIASARSARDTLSDRARIENPAAPRKRASKELSPGIGGCSRIDRGGSF